MQQFQPVNGFEQGLKSLQTVVMLAQKEVGFPSLTPVALMIFLEIPSLDPKHLACPEVCSSFFLGNPAVPWTLSLPAELNIRCY